MRRIKLVVAVVAVMVMLVSSAVPATAAEYEGGPVGPICQCFYTNGDLGYYPNSDSAEGGYYENVWGWHLLRLLEDVNALRKLGSYREESQPFLL